MHLKDRKLKFSSITHHASVTQCLGSIGGHEWYLGVAKASIVDPNRIDDDNGRKVVKSTNCGHYYLPPVPDEVHVFRIVGPKFLKLNVGTWHAGPLFKAKTMDFYNLELSNTNVSASPSPSFFFFLNDTFMISICMLFLHTLDALLHLLHHLPL